MSGMRGIEVVLREKGIGRARDVRGRFIARDVTALRSEMTMLAERAQANVVANIASRLVRPNASTGRLEKVTASSRNRVVQRDGLGFGVGVIDYLDKSEAKYWRTIEEGSKKVWGERGKSMVGMEIHGKFGAEIVGWRDSSWGPRPKAGPPWNVQGGVFQAIRKLPAVTIQNDIHPMHAYQDVYEGSGIFDREGPEVVRDFLRRSARRAIEGRD